MKRIEVEFTDEQMRALERRARSGTRSVPELVREAVAASLRNEFQPDRDELIRRAREAYGRFRVGPADLATEHDRYLGG